jgi:hypothetical protein
MFKKKPTPPICAKPFATNLALYLSISPITFPLILKTQLLPTWPFSLLEFCHVPFFNNELCSSFFIFFKNEPSFLHRTQKIVNILSMVVMHSKLKGLEGVPLT